MRGRSARICVLLLLTTDWLVHQGFAEGLVHIDPLSHGMRAGRQLNRFFIAGRLSLEYFPRGSTSSLFLRSQAGYRWLAKKYKFDSVSNFSLTATPQTSMATASSSSGNASPSDYEHWVRRLYETNMFHPVKMGLANIESLYEALGKPMDSTIVVHIAGTNGKGSVALKTAHTLHLSNSNLKIGLFCSPHVSSFRERMQVNGEMISEEEVVDLLPKIYELCRLHDIPATFFEITTALAFTYFAARQADVVVLETGLGGRLDATNVIAAPALSIITSIGLEHTRILGDTIELIAIEKGGIIKPSRPVLVGPNVPHDVLRKCAADKGASNYYTCDDVLGAPTDLSEADLEDYDVENARVASAGLKLLQRSHSNVVGVIPDDILCRGTAIRPPCRFEHVQLDSGLTVILDVAHNPPAMDYLVKKLRKAYPARKVRMVVGMSSDKDITLCGHSVLVAVDGDASRVHFVEAAHPRAAKLEAILEVTNLYDHAHYDMKDPSITKQIALATALALQNDEILVVCGSVFLMAEAREALGFDEPRDSAYIAAVAGAGVRHGQENFGNSTTTTTSGRLDPKLTD
jgi:dihydrofolate synthase / folylpolyglutamate synthase